MRIIHNFSTDPFFNLAAEEFLLDHTSGEIIMLWRNSPAVIIGRNQNAYAELSEQFVTKHEIKVVRRLTGGGAVFHDLGNLNFTFIIDDGKDGGGQLDFARFTRPVIELLRSLGLDAEQSGRNDITAGGYKISGNAQCRYNNKTMHHGTLLFSANLDSMSGALKVDPAKLLSKGIESVRSRVSNIRPMLANDMDITEFISYIADNLEGELLPLTDAEKDGIAKLASEKYSTWEWNYGQSKEFARRRKHKFIYGTVEIEIALGGGIIIDARITGDFFGMYPISQIEAELIGVKCVAEDVHKALSGISDYIFGSSADDIAPLIL